jgi:hypothetical protein
LLKRARYVLCQVRLCIGQDRSPVSSQHREEMQSPISPAADSLLTRPLTSQSPPTDRLQAINTAPQQLDFRLVNLFSSRLLFKIINQEK